MGIRFAHAQNHSSPRRAYSLPSGHSPGGRACFPHLEQRWSSAMVPSSSGSGGDHGHWEEGRGRGWGRGAESWVLRRELQVCMSLGGEDGLRDHISPTAPTWSPVLGAASSAEWVPLWAPRGPWMQGGGQAADVGPCGMDGQHPQGQFVGLALGSAPGPRGLAPLSPLEPQRVCALGPQRDVTQAGDNAEPPADQTETRARGRDRHISSVPPGAATGAQITPPMPFPAGSWTSAASPPWPAGWST